MDNWDIITTFVFNFKKQFMSRFLKTVRLVDNINQKIILKVDTCSQCPLLQIDSDNCIAFCRKFCDSTHDDTLDDFIINYNMETGEVYDKIDIPNWCELSESKTHLLYDHNTYIIQNDKMLIKKDDKETIHNLPEINAEDLFPEKTNGFGSDSLSSIISSSALSKSVNDASARHNDDNDGQYDIFSEHDFAVEFGNRGNNLPARRIKYDECSVCGEGCETVNRDINNGTCTKCWEEIKSDKTKVSQAFIMNFRLKRGGDFTTKPYKIILDEK